MISGINGFNANVNYDFSSSRGQNLKAREEKEAINLTSNSAPSRSNLTEPIDYYALDPDELDENELAVWAQNVEFSKLNDKQQNRLLAIKMGFKKPIYKPYDPVVARKAYSLSGYTEDDKISVWGKINGLDPSMSKDEVADLKKFKLPKDNPLFIKNELNKIANLDGYYLETLKKPMGDQGEIVREARQKLINLGSLADIKKFAPDLDEKEIMTLIARFAKDEINLSNDEILELLNSDKISKDSFGISAATLKNKIAPDAVIGIFERLKNERQEAQEAYVYLLFEFEMLERAQEVLAGLEAGEYQNFRTLLYLRQNGKNVPTDLFFKHAHC